MEHGTAHGVQGQRAHGRGGRGGPGEKSEKIKKFLGGLYANIQKGVRPKEARTTPILAPLLGI